MVNGQLETSIGIAKIGRHGYWCDVDEHQGSDDRCQDERTGFVLIRTRVATLRIEKEGFKYTSVHTDLLVWVIERATDSRLIELVKELLCPFTRCGIRI